jgi:hypothetical protein
MTTTGRAAQGRSNNRRGQERQRATAAWLRELGTAGWIMIIIMIILAALAAAFAVSIAYWWVANQVTWWQYGLIGMVTITLSSIRGAAKKRGGRDSGTDGR